MGVSTCWCPPWCPPCPPPRHPPVVGAVGAADGGVGAVRDEPLAGLEVAQADGGPLRRGHVGAVGVEVTQEEDVLRGRMRDRGGPSDEPCPPQAVPNVPGLCAQCGRRQILEAWPLRGSNGCPKSCRAARPTWLSALCGGKAPRKGIGATRELHPPSLPRHCGVAPAQMGA